MPQVLYAQPLEAAVVGESHEVLLIAVVFGFFPRVSTHNITYFAVPQFQVLTIPIEQFTGYIGIFFIWGLCNPNPCV